MESELANDSFSRLDLSASSVAAGPREGAAEAQAPREVVPPGRVARRDVRVGVEVHVVAPPRPDPGEGTADPQLRRELVQEAVGGPVEVPPP